MTGEALELAARVDALLPQTQCTRCGYPGCEPYSQAIVRGEAEINQCPPGGTQTIHALADLLQRSALPLNPANGIESPPRVAWIDEARCIGCARCLPPCPVDAIVGAARFMHTVLPSLCTGCELCLAPCPVDCIVMQPASVPSPNEPARNRARFDAHVQRLANRAAKRQRELEAKKAAAPRQAPES
jgi:electron transport complex protein RnfB